MNNEEKDEVTTKNESSKEQIEKVEEPKDNCCGGCS